MPDGRATAARVVCGFVGAALLIIGIIGLAQGGLSGFSPTPEGTADQTDSFFGGSTLLSIIHIIIGALALFAAVRRGARIAALFGMLAFTALVAYDIVALIANDPDDPLGSRWPALVLHVLGLAASVMVSMGTRAAGDFAERESGR